MISAEEVVAQLTQLLEDSYYSEDFEIIAAVRHFHASLDAAGQSHLRAEIRRRLQAEGTIVDVLLCAAVPSPENARELAVLLDGEGEATQMSRALIRALCETGNPAGFSAIARFIDSDQELEALAALHRLDFFLALPWLASRMGKPGYDDTCVHILASRKQEAGLPQLIDDLRSFQSRDTRLFRREIARLANVKPEGFNPFRIDERLIIERALEFP